MNQMKGKIWKGIGAIVLALAMLITMLPVMDVWADIQDVTDKEGPNISSILFEYEGKNLKVERYLKRESLK